MVSSSDNDRTGTSTHNAGSRPTALSQKSQGQRSHYQTTGGIPPERRVPGVSLVHGLRRRSCQVSIGTVTPSSSNMATDSEYGCDRNERCKGLKPRPIYTESKPIPPSLQSASVYVAPYLASRPDDTILGRMMRATQTTIGHIVRTTPGVDLDSEEMEKLIKTLAKTLARTYCTLRYDELDERDGGKLDETAFHGRTLRGIEKHLPNSGIKVLTTVNFDLVKERIPESTRLDGEWLSYQSIPGYCTITNKRRPLAKCWRKVRSACRSSLIPETEAKAR